MKQQKKPVVKLDIQANTTEQHKKQAIEAMKKSLGIVSKACAAIKISRTTFYEWIKTDEEFKAEILDIEEYQLDFVEGKLLKLINDENPTAVIFYLKTKGRKRGFVERTEVTGADGKDLNPNITIEIIDSTDKVKPDAGS